LPLIYSPGVLRDPRLREAITRITQATVQDKIARAADAKGVFEGTLAGLFAGMSYPAAIQGAHYLALQGAVTAKLKGDLTRRTGWGVAGLYAADAAYRIATDQGKNLALSSEQIARALTSDPAIAMPALAALVTSLARYAALGIDGKLEIEQVGRGARLSPERRAAKEALRRAIAGLGEQKDAPEGLVDDITELADGLVTTLSHVLSARGQKDGQTCPTTDNEGPNPATRRALAKLGDVRRRILLHPRYKAQGAGDGDAFVRRARMLVTILSDAMDIAGKKGARPAFTISSREAEQHVAAALRDWDERAGADAIASGYALVRDLLSAKSADAFAQQNGQNLRKVLRGLVAFFRSGNDARGAGVALLDAIASMPLPAPGTAPGATTQGGDLLGLFLGYADEFYARGSADQGDLWLLATLVISGLTESPPSPKAIELAAKRSSRIEWALRFLSEVAAARRGSPPDTAAYDDKIRKAADDACTTGSVGDTLTVMAAVRDFLSGKRSEARAALDKLLDEADARGLNVPKMTYKYEEKTATKVFSVALGVSYGGGLLDGSNTFQIGLGIKSRGEPGGSMMATLSPTDSAQGGDETARYYVSASALASVYHFLEGDPARAQTAARRAIGALTAGVRLGPRVLPGGDLVTWGADARASLAVAATLAAEASMPFLAGDLWTVVRASLPSDHDDDAVAKILSRAPFGLAGVKEIPPVLERAARSLKVVAAPLPCTAASAPLGAFEEPACDAYPLALSLRIADVVKKLPRLRRGAQAGASAGAASRRCAVMRALDTFLAAADKGTYDPDAFMAAVEELRADGLLYDAAALLTRHKREGHCSPAIVAAARALAGTTSLGPGLRADLYGTAVNCSLASVRPELIEDLASLDAETRKLADPTRNLRVILFTTDLSLREGRFEPIARLAASPDFVDRWMDSSPGAALAALLIHHAALTLSGAPLAAEKTGPAYQLLCETFPARPETGKTPMGAETDMCAEVRSLRPPFKIPIEGRQKLARLALQRLVKQAFDAPKSPPP
jgi:hypothetical protein